MLSRANIFSQQELCELVHTRMLTGVPTSNHVSDARRQRMSDLSFVAGILLMSIVLGPVLVWTLERWMNGQRSS
jgi:uncharacterized Tic20 family protein